MNPVVSVRYLRYFQLKYRLGICNHFLKSLLRKLYGRHRDFVDRYGISVSQMTTDMFHLS